MTAWTPNEIEAEIARRVAEEARRDREHAEALRRSDLARANAACIHCGTPFVSYDADDLLCDACLGD